MQCTFQNIRLKIIPKTSNGNRAMFSYGGAQIWIIYYIRYVLISKFRLIHTFHHKKIRIRRQYFWNEHFRHNLFYTWWIHFHPYCYFKFSSITYRTWCTHARTNVLITHLFHLLVHSIVLDEALFFFGRMAFDSALNTAFVLIHDINL